MKVLFIGITFHKSGVVTVYRHLIEGFEKIGVESRLIETFVGDTPYQSYNIIAKKSDIEKILNSREFENFNPDIIHIHTWACADPDMYSGGLYKILKHYDGPPIIFTFHLSDVRQGVKINGEKQILQIMDISKKIICISEDQKKNMEIRFPKFRDKYVTIHNVTKFDKYENDQEVLRKAKTLKNALGSRKIMMWVGRLETIKFAKEFVAAFNFLAERHNDLHLFVAGTSKKNAKEDLINNFGLDKRFSDRVHNVTWLPKEREKTLAAHYKMMSLEGISGVLVSPHPLKEMYNLTAMEALILKSPIITNGILATYSTSVDVTKIVQGVEYILYSGEENEIREKIDEAYVLAKDEYSLGGSYFIPLHLETYREAMVLAKRPTQEIEALIRNIKKPIAVTEIKEQPVIDKDVLEKALKQALEKKDVDKSLLENSLKEAVGLRKANIVSKEALERSLKVAQRKRKKLEV